jgi:hypothetical protein
MTWRRDFLTAFGLTVGGVLGFGDTSSSDGDAAPSGESDASTPTATPTADAEVPEMVTFGALEIEREHGHGLSILPEYPTPTLRVAETITSDADAFEPAPEPAAYYLRFWVIYAAPADAEYPPQPEQFTIDCEPPSFTDRHVSKPYTASHPDVETLRAPYGRFDTMQTWHRPDDPITSHTRLTFRIPPNYQPTFFSFHPLGDGSPTTVPLTNGQRDGWGGGTDGGRP